jgi:S1-C subfamily serine protease
VEEKPVDSREAFSTYTATVPTNQPLRLSIIRGGSPSQVVIRPVDAPGDLGLRILEEVAGLRVVDQSRSVVIDQVIAGSRAANIRLASGDVIVGVNGVEVGSTKDLNNEIIRAADRSSIVLSVARDRYIYNLTFPMGI